MAALSSVLWICGFGEINVENRAVFWLLLDSSGTAPRQYPGWAEYWAESQGGKKVIEYNIATKTGTGRTEEGVGSKVAVAGNWCGLSLLVGGGEQLPLHPDSLLPFTQLSGSQPKSFLTSGHSVLSHFTGGKCFCNFPRIFQNWELYRWW